MSTSTELQAQVQTLPLAGMNVLVTRPEGAADVLISRLQSQGAEVLHFPAIRTIPPPSYAALDAALDQLHTYDWLVFTSANGIRFMVERLATRHVDPYEELRTCKIAVIGAGTERELACYRVSPALVPPEAIAESLRDALLQRGVGAGTRVLLPQPVEGRDVVAVGLRAVGATVDIAPAYQTVANTEGSAAVRRWLDGPGAKAAVVASPSTVRGLLASLDGDIASLARMPLVCIGPVTAAAVTELGLAPALVAADHTNDGLIAALIVYVNAKGVPAA